MAMKLDNVVPFGRALDEYRQMFCLSGSDLDSGIIGVGDGPASFNAEMFRQGRRVVSVDPLYCFSAAEIARRFDAVVDDIIAQVKATPEDWVWTYHGSPEQLKLNRIRALQFFASDFEAGKSEGRYVLGELPSLAFGDGSFQLALCSHFLFLYSAHFSYDFHRASVLEMLRIASEVRIFPLLTLMRERSPHLEPLIGELESRGFVASVEKVGYELQRGGDEMLRIRRSA
ncbi:MAG: SAM-dependent methyltransferase [Candidatus Sumerlaeia bacterium]|nr:SAM-dependent methyltransferase [Candidatus Sumerlaeia bacterium]